MLESFLRPQGEWNTGLDEECLFWLHQALPLGFQPLSSAPNSTRRQPMSIGIFGAPLSDATVSACLPPCVMMSRPSEPMYPVRSGK